MLEREPRPAKDDRSVQVPGEMNPAKSSAPSPRDGMRRNACIVLGNRGDSGALPALRLAAVGSDPVLREHALWAIGRIEGRAR